MTNYSELKRKAQEIRDEVKTGANTASRVGLALEETVNALEAENERAEQAEISLENAVQLLQDETEDLPGIREKLTELENEVTGKKTYRSCSFTQQNGKLLNADGHTSSYSNWAVTDYIDIRNFYGIRFVATQFPGSPFVSVQFYDEQKNIMENLISIPTNYEILGITYSYVRVCFLKSGILNVDEIYLDGRIVKSIEDINNSIEDINNSIEDINNSIEDIDNKIKDISEPIQYEITSRRLLNKDGSVTNNSSSAWGVSNLIQVKAGEKCSIFATQFPESPYVGIQVLDSNASTIIRNYIKNIDLFDGQTKDIIFENDGYLRINVRISDGFENAISIVRTLSEIVESLLHAVSDIDNINQKIIDINETVESLLYAVSDNKITINKNINFVGMSIWWYDGRQLASGHAGGEIAEGYQTLLKRQFTFLSDTKTNYCYSGNSLGAINSDDTSCIMNHAGTWGQSENAIWTIDTITNDFKRNIPIGSYSDYTNKTGITTYYGALREFADKINALSGNDVIVICSNALRRNNSGYTSTSQNTQGHRLVDYEHALMDIASRNHWYFVDQFRLCGVTDDSIDLTTIDGLHLNNFGYSLAVKPWIEQLNIIGRTLL